jgi:hypothetical protein
LKRGGSFFLGRDDPDGRWPSPNLGFEPRAQRRQCREDNAGHALVGSEARCDIAHQRQMPPEFAVAASGQDEQRPPLRNAVALSDLG